MKLSIRLFSRKVFTRVNCKREREQNMSIDFSPMFPVMVIIDYLESPALGIGIGVVATCIR